MNASNQVQEYLEGMKIIKSCGLSGVHFKSLDNALLAMKKIAVKEENSGYGRKRKRSIKM